MYIIGTQIESRKHKQDLCGSIREGTLVLYQSMALPFAVMISVRKSCFSMNLTFQLILQIGRKMANQFVIGNFHCMHYKITFVIVILWSDTLVHFITTMYNPPRRPVTVRKL